MKEGEAVGDYFGRVMALVSLMRAFGENIADQVVVEKILWSLTTKFDYVVPLIEINNDLATITPVKLMGSYSPNKKGLTAGLPRSLMERRRKTLIQGRGRGRGQNSPNSKIPHCSYCNKYGHDKKECWYNEEIAATTSAENESQEDDERLFMALTNEKSSGNETTFWFLDSGASNHMT
ncbi:uncharacterized protein LOC143564248 [Bidens hawaiensis]|uniref:uncharacterized protein LOC143564248 n=1 Tax=Bidens hawaiensis TaxID=980011 RepID=UPI0040499223